MTSSTQPPEHLHLERLIVYPREDLDAEYKSWLNLRMDKDRATLAKATIALANHGGGFIVIGFEERNGTLQSTPCPLDVPQVAHDAVNESVRRYAEPEFHCQVYDVTHPNSGAVHSVIGVPRSEVPVMSKRDQKEAGVYQHRYYIRKPGPRSEEPHTAEEWRRLIDRCIRVRREDMLDSIRSIFLGRVETRGSATDPLETLRKYCIDSYERWGHLVTSLPYNSPPRFPLGSTRWVLLWSVRPRLLVLQSLDVALQMHRV